MELTNRYEVLSRTYRNPTKLGVLLLLAETDRMTVTQMSKYIKVSRSNLYHFVSQLVDDNVLNQPEIVPKKNYVEKYYSLNQEMFKSFDVKEWEKHLVELTVEEIRDLVSSVLAGESLLLKLAAENIAKAQPKEIEKLRVWFKEQAAWVSYSVLGARTTKRIGVQIRRLVEELTAGQVSGEEEDTGLSRLLIVFLPIIGGTLG